MAEVYKIDRREMKTYKRNLANYFLLNKFENADMAEIKADEAYKNLISGLGIDGREVTNDENEFFDILMENETQGYYKPTARKRHKHPKFKPPPKGPDFINDINQLVLLNEDDIKLIETIKQNLLKEYSHLNRTDLKDQIDNYCRVTVMLKKLLSLPSFDNKDVSVTIKNFTDTQIRMGTALGIDEGRKAKQKEMEDKQSVAAMSKRYQETIGKFPQIRERMRYEEIRILLEKYDRQEIDRILFASPAYAGMTIEEARDFVLRKESVYDK